MTYKDLIERYNRLATAFQKLQAESVGQQAELTAYKHALQTANGQLTDLAELRRAISEIDDVIHGRIKGEKLVLILEIVRRVDDQRVRSLV